MKLIKNINVYAPEHLGNKDVLIIGDKIAKIEEAGCMPEIPYLTAEDIIDGSGKILTPGFIDCHVHVLGGGGEGVQAHAVGVADHGNDQSRVQSHCHTQVYMGPLDDLVAVQAHQHLRVLAQALGRGLEDQIVDGILAARLGQEHLAELHQLRNIHLGVLGNRGDLRVGLQHTLSHHLAHTRQLGDGVALHQLQPGLAHGLGGGGGLDSHRGRSLRSLGGSQHILLADTAAGAAAHDTADIHAQLGRRLAGQGGDADTGAACGHGSGHRSGGGSGCGGSSRGGRGSGSGGGGIAYGLAGLAHIAQQALHGYILALLG